jgi:hypothetical protein
MRMMGGVMKPLGVLLLAICRTVYCWMFFIMSFFMIYSVYASIRSALQTHINEGRSIWGGVNMAAYSIVFDITWWMFVRRKPALKQWAIAANLICILTYLPVALVYWNWRSFLRVELNFWPVILIGIFGIIIFSIPYHGWRLDQLDEVVSTTSRAS